MSASSSASLNANERIIEEISLPATGQTIQLIDGYLLHAVDTDAIVYAEVSGQLELSGTDILAEAGSSVQEQAKNFVMQNGPLDSSDKVAFVSGGNLKARYIIFAAGPMWKGGKKNERSSMEEIVQTCLEESNKKQLSSIGFDAMCTDLFGFPIERSAEALINAIGSYCHFKPFPYLNLIKIYVKEEEKLRIFKLALNEAFRTYLNSQNQDESKKRKNETEESTHTEIIHEQPSNQQEDVASSDDDEASTHDSKRVKGLKKANNFRNPSWKRNRHENSLLAKSKKTNIHDKTTNMSLVGDTMSISTSIAMEDFSGMNDEDQNNAEDAAFDMTFL
ncbi:hypothetical protein C9374_003039 [Naegleria lovaniensis]|uniref:Macro domain-containing protein n=1 Tax=Naegleria lovaniensis TaxID=51637 RepID=A0AA88GS74_NAELO|nr:uncharacterized protein C9374_003039 [Naegleria lovaniensis]KAG2385890.1 hypothetical protein C9374_003039 [Naegleria lovaniensis]